MSNVYSSFGTRITPQNEPILGQDMVQNHAGGYVYKLDPLKQLERFLILGSEGGTYYVGERKLTKENAENTIKCVDTFGRKAVDLIVSVSDAGRAPKNDPAIFALAIAASAKDPETRAYALSQLSKVCRIPTHLFHFVTYLKNFRGIGGRGVKRALGEWYNSMPVDKLAYEVVKYQQRDGWANSDVLRQCHVKTDDPARNDVYCWIVDGLDGLIQYQEKTGYYRLLPNIIYGFEQAKKTDDAGELVKLIKTYNLSREMLPTEALNHAEVWEALLEKMPYTAMLRNLGNMSRVGLLKPLSGASRTVCERLLNEESIRKARVHPISVLLALKTYAQGHGMKGKGVWEPVAGVIDALDSAFYLAFNTLEVTNDGILIGIDCSGSMTYAQVAGIPMSAAEGAAAMAMACLRAGKDYHTVSYDTKVQRLPPLSPKMRLDQVLKLTSNLTGGGTDCSVPIQWAIANKVSPDLVLNITDGETWAGKEHVSQALKRLRQQSGIAVKSIAIGMTATNLTINPPDDPLCLDVAGFSADVPALVQEFGRQVPAKSCY